MGGREHKWLRSTSPFVMDPIEYLCKDNVSRFMRIDADATGAFGFYYQDRVMTPHGPGSVLGVHSGHLYFRLDHDAAASYWSSCRCESDFIQKGFQKIPDSVSVPENPMEYHRVKKIEYRGKASVVVMQSVNGPCPVLALSNALLLKGVWTSVSNSSSPSVRAEELRKKLLQQLLVSRDRVEFVSPHERDGSVKTIAGVMSDEDEVEKQRVRLQNSGEEILRRFYAGLDVSPCFGYVDGFDGQQDALLFALAGVRLFHSWFLTTDNVEFAQLRDKSYDELTVLVATDNAENAELVTLIRRFLDHYVNQVTPEGLQEVHRTMAEGEVAVLFLNNHFGTIVKLGDKLLRLASDESFADKPYCVFEVIWDEDGRWTNSYCDGDGDVLHESVLRVLLQPGNRHTLDEVRLAFAQAVSNQIEFPTVADLEALLAPPPPPAQTTAPAAPSPQRPSTAPRRRSARNNEPFDETQLDENSAADPGPVGRRSPVARQELFMNEQAVADAVEQITSMGFSHTNLAELVRCYGTVDAVVEYLLTNQL